jgi:KaiC/GvpD/RAD55 family RecA-like ATPase
MPTETKNLSLIPTLDKLLGGGLNPGSNILLYGEPLCGKKLLLMQYIYEGLRSQTPGIFVLTDFGYLEWKKRMKNSGWDIEMYEQNGMVQAIDCFSRQFEPSLKTGGNISFANGPAALSNISLHIAKIQDMIVQEFPQHRFALHSLSSLLEENDEQTFFRFLQFMTGRFRREGAISFFTLEKGMHDQKQVTMIEHLMDGIIEFENGKLRAKGIAGADESWYPYEVTLQGIKIKT